MHLNRSTSPAPTPRASHAQGGFALVIVLGLMAFILLLLLSITSLVRVETQSVQISSQRLQAEQNALLGLQQAIGKLQMSVGPDSRVTVASEMFDDSPDTAQVSGVATRYYTGVFRAHDSAQLLEAFRATQNTPAAAIQWLASAETDILDPVAAAASTYSAETISIAKVYQADTNTLEDIDVGKVAVDAEETGAFAWWVADEGMKAKFNTIDPGIGNADTEGPLDEDKLTLIQTRQSNFSHVSDPDPNDPSSGFGKAFADLRNEGNLPKVYDAQSLALLSSDWGDWMLPEDPADPSVTATMNPSVTLFSRGLPVDVTHGRLKEDLTVYLETDKGLEDDEHIVRGSSDDTNYRGPDFGAQLTSDPLTDNLPRFGLLRSWHDQGKAIGEGGSVQNQPQTNTQHGFHPTVMRAGVSFTVVRVGDPIDLDDVDDPTDTLMQVTLQPMVYVRLALLNPYNFTLPAEQYLFEVSIPDRLYLQWVDRNDYPPSGVSNNHGRIPFKGDPVAEAPDTVVELADFLADGIIQSDNYTWHGNRAWLRMTVDTGHGVLGDAGGMLPGESLNYTPEHSRLPLADSVYVDQPAGQYRAGQFVNYADPINEELADLSNCWALGPQITVSVPKSRAPIAGGTLYPDERDYDFSLRYQYDTPFIGGEYTLDHSLSWRLSLLGDAEPTLLSSKDPTKTLNSNSAFSVNGFDDCRKQNRRVSFYFMGMKYFANVGSSPSGTSHKIEVSMHDFWAAAARKGNSRHGGDRRNAVLNPRGGILREDLDLSDWGVEAHRISMYREEQEESFWAVREGHWIREEDLHTGNPGTVEGRVATNGGNTSLNLTGTRYTFYDTPRRFGTITSLGQLQHANLNPFGFGSTYQVGFSRAAYHVERDELVESTNTSLPNERIDLPYMVNASLWDRFYLSTIPQSGNLNLDASNLSVLANNRHVLTPDASGAFPAEGVLRDSETAFAQSAAHIQIDGAFNINSVSVDAWEAVLLQAAGKTIPTERDGELNTAESETFVAFPRFPDPVYGVADDAAFDTLDPQDAKQHAGLFVTDRGDIRILAEQIVAEIKRRGPFLSMADFVNRRLLPDADDLDLDYQGLMGTLDAAIMRASQTENVLNYQQIFGRTVIYQQQLDPLKLSGTGSNAEYAMDMESGFGVPKGHKNTALEGSSANLTQGDLLQALGSQLSARSDTFVIRAYGESTDPISGEVIASARCEAVVQRIAEPVETNDSILEPTGDFGRRFVVTAFRWLDDGS